MALAIVMGLAAVVVAGVLQGLFAVPMKYAPRWNYEHIWLTYSLAGMDESQMRIRPELSSNPQKPPLL